MTVQTNTTVATGIGNGVTSVFPITYKFNRAEDLIVYLVDEETEEETPLTLHSDYTITGAGNESGGSLALLAGPLPVGQNVVALRVVDMLQETDLRNQGRFFAEVHEDVFDKLVMIDQQQQEQLDRTLKINPFGWWNALWRRIINVGDPVGQGDATNKRYVDSGDAASREHADKQDAKWFGRTVRTPEPIAMLPEAEGRAGQVLAFDSSGNPVTVIPVTDSAAELRLALADSNQGPSLIGYKGRTVAKKLAETVSVFDYGIVGDGVADDYANLLWAITDSDEKGHTLDWLDAKCRVTQAINAFVNKINWKASGAEVIIDTDGDVAIGMLITVSEQPGHRILGTGLTVDAAGKCNIAFRILQPKPTVTATLMAEGMGGKNVEKQIGTPSSSGVSVRGGFGFVELVKPKASNIAMRPGAGAPLVSGVSGIHVMDHSGEGVYAKRITLIEPEVDRVYSQDPTYQSDQDGIGVFANPRFHTVHGYSYVEIIRPKISRCWGRDVKVQAGFCRIESPDSLISEGPSTGMELSAYDFQTGPGELIGGNYRIVGVTRHGGIVRFNGQLDNESNQSKWDGGTVDIDSSAEVSYLFAHEGEGLNARTSTVSRDITVRGEIDYFARVRVNAADQDFINLKNVTVNKLRQGLVQVEARTGGEPPYVARVYAEQCKNLSNNMVPLLLQNVPGSVATAILSSKDNFGFAETDRRYNQNSTSFSGGGIQEFRFPASIHGLSLTGSERFFSITLGSGEEYLLPGHGYDLSSMVEIKSSMNSRNGYAVLSYDSGGIVEVFRGSLFSVGVGEPVAGDYRIWLDGGRLRLKNAQGAARSFLIRMFG